MANRSPEQGLIDEFVAHLKQHKDDNLRIETVINTSCKSKNYADVEFRSAANLHWVIEAKSDESKDRHNTIHKIFGELLKETGKTSRSDCCYAILIPESAVGFYSRAFQSIAREKFLGFGELIPIDTVFTSSATGIGQLSWESLYDDYKP
ncbi:hypothetical protein [Nitrosomonas halophila]|uniref:Restriction endonuclease n=1 Tax=Nitrosomonas halophila TaxID=44576 RepID=A0A1H3NK64_9PROT|nr:hypothetical protein [Nitrosomonas halophila]SDY89133.1 hypothetical protein SAMN05421881_10755 [Nitrosomonas halophila]